MKPLPRRLRGILAGVLLLSCSFALSAYVVHLYTKADNYRRAQALVGELQDAHFAELNLIESLLDGNRQAATSAGWRAVGDQRAYDMRALRTLHIAMPASFMRAEGAYQEMAQHAWDAVTAGLIAEGESTEQRMETTPLVALRSEADNLVADLGQMAHSSDVRADVQTLVVTLGLSLILIMMTLWLSRVRDRDARARIDLVRKKDDWLESLLSSSTEMITVTDAAGVVAYSSPPVERWLGWKPDERVGKSAWELIHPHDIRAVQAALNALGTHPGDCKSAEFRVQASDGTWHHVEATGRYVRSDALYIVTNYKLIDERKRYERELVEKAFSDPLTGLANRNLLEDRVEHALRRRDSATMHPMFALVDLDEFKVVNDGFGHTAGDQLLCSVGERLSSCCRPEDTVARLGGDEFVVFTEGARERNLAEFGRRILDAFERPFEIASRPVRVRGSVGLASGAYDLDTFEELLRAADVAMYRAKASGKNRYSIFNDSFRSEAVRRAQIISEVESGIAEDQFEIFFQPIVTLPEGRLRGAEALVRWKHPTKGILGPSDFIPVAEESGTIIPLGLHILTLSCDWLAETKEDLPIGFDLHVNVAARQLYDGEFPNVLAGIVKARELDAHHVVIEVTETGLMPNVSAINDTLGGIARMRFAIAIDDFGTGSSSLAHLRQLPINILKIDSSFVRRIQPHNKTAPISRAVIQLGKSLGFETIAEGIETRLQARVLTRLGCRLGQGYLFGRPMPSASFIEMARDQTRSSALLSTSLVSAGRGAS